jgi:hypothetical protein
MVQLFYQIHLATQLLNSILERQLQAFQLQGGKELPMVSLKNMPEPSPIEKIEFTRIDAENKRKIADIELKYKELQQDNQKMMLDFEIRMKDIALKYNTQIDTAKIKADADLDKTMINEEGKILDQATKSANMFQKQIQGLNGNQRPGRQSGGSEPIKRSQVDIGE